MAETVGTVATVIQLVDTALKAREYIQDFIHAPQEQQKLLMEMDDLRPLLGELHKRISANLSSGVLHQMQIPLTNFKATMEDLTDKLRPGDGRFSKFSKQLKWTLWSKKEAKEYLDKFEQFKSLLNSWLLVDIWDMGQQHIHDHSAVLTLVANVASQASSGFMNFGDAISEQKNSAERTQIIEWLSPINFFLRQADISRVRQAGTGGWLLADSHFQQWKFGAGRTLWCRGIPGAGKTVLASMVVDHLNTEFESQNIGVAFAYLNHKEADDQIPVSIFSGLWRQLILGRDIGSKTRKLYERHREKCTAATLDEVFAVLRSAIAEYSKVYIIADALDEHPEKQRHTLLEYFAEMGPTVNLMITSRPHITPDDSLPNLEALEIRASEEDVRRYVDGQIRTSSRLSKHVRTRSDLQEEIHSKITRTVDGMFLLAKLHVESLITKTTVKAVRDALKDLPKDLKNSYDNAMKRIDSQNEEDRSVAHSTLTWVVNAVRPLKVADLQVALSIEPGAPQLDADNLLDIEIILSSCAGLVIVDEQLSVVRLVHYTTQEYLDSIQPQRFPEAQMHITRTLLTYLAFDDFLDPPWAGTEDELPPLVEYSQYVLHHAGREPVGQLTNMIVEFLGQASRWKTITGPRWSSPPWDFLFWPEDPSELWVAAGANLLKIVQLLLEQGSFGKYPGISVAGYYGHLQMVQLLVENGVSVNAQDTSYGYVLQAAACGGSLNVVRWLIENGADIATYGGPFGGALQGASFYCHLDIVTLLLEKGVDVDAYEDGYDTALTMACERGDMNLVQFLLGHGADVNVEGCGDQGSALHAACLWGHPEIVQLLVDHGADVNAMSAASGSPLHAATLGKSAEVFQLLIDSGADIDVQDEQDEDATPLATAAIHGHENMVQLLIDNGADLNALGGTYGTAIQAAAFQGHDQIVELLLQNGANPNMQGGEYDSAVQAASYSGHQKIVQLLIQYGADVNLQGGKGGNALQAAFSSAHEVIVRILRENGAE